MEEAEETDFRDWAAENNISSKAVGMLSKMGWNVMICHRYCRLDSRRDFGCIQHRKQMTVGARHIV